MRNYKMIIAYDGGCYLGWQTTKMGPSIEETIQTYLEQILQHPIVLQAASRTDAHVHAEGQVVNFYSAKAEIDCHRLLLSLNSLLPKDIAILAIEPAENHFHPTLDAIAKEYHYYLSLGPVQMPHFRHYSWHVPYPLNFDEIEKAIPILTGSHDFSSFCNTKKNATYSHYTRHIEAITLLFLEGGRMRIAIKGHHFLYKMVRNLVGTLVYIGRGKISLESLPSILAGKSRPLAGMTAPAHGLFLHKVYYSTSLG